MTKYYIQFDSRTNMALMTIRTDVPYDVLPLNTFEISENLYEMPIGQITLIDNNPTYIDTPKPYPWDMWDSTNQQWIDGRNIDEWKANIKTERDRKLYQSDWTQIPNNPLTFEKQQEWAVYRQALRDVTKQSGYPLNVVWPMPPLQ